MSHSRLPRWTLVRVRWIDSSDVGVWESMDQKEKRKPLICETVGWVVRHAKHSIELATTRARDKEQVHGCFTIPMVAVERITKLGKPNGGDEWRNIG